eukprot:TRINITY_DN4786_c0_g2_i1.p1 TRINITY_DN4786_c0_g2~~TRINITY_DN4786_c0_g2_i1.p1  ORF type:complete len:353 (+),score=100.61 TRINITY_DN4786_c0_g2_i1:2-1060(+)
MTTSPEVLSTGRENLPPEEHIEFVIGGKRPLLLKENQVGKDWKDCMAMETAKCSEKVPLSATAKEGGDEGFWRNFAKKARSVLLEDGIPFHAEEVKLCEQLKHAKGSSDERTTGVQQGIQKGLDTIVGTLSMIGDSLGTALEEGIHKLEKASEVGILGFEGTPGLVDGSKGSPRLILKASSAVSAPGSDAQLKASRDVANAMARKAKQLIRELKAAHVELETCQERCALLEAENRRLREEGGITREEEDDLMRLQLETLLREKNRLAQENAALERGNQALQELIDYHHVKEGVVDGVDAEDTPDQDLQGPGSESKGRRCSFVVRQPYWEVLDTEEDLIKDDENDTERASSPS